MTTRKPSSRLTDTLKGRLQARGIDLTTSTAAGEESLVVSRRGFLRLSGYGGGSLVLGCYLPLSGTPEVNAAPAVDAVELNTFISLAKDGTITIYSPGPEMGQGVKTSLPMIVAEEMCADWSSVRTEAAPVEERFGRQSSGGSTNIWRHFQAMRIVGATTREMLLAAAAERMKLPRTELRAEQGRILHSSGRSIAFAELVGPELERQPVPSPETLTFKDPSTYTLLGTRVGQTDNADIVQGRPLFGIDQQVPGMLYGTFVKCAVLGGKVVSANLEEVRRAPGVKDAFVVRGTGNPSELSDGIAIVGSSTWAVLEARKKLQVQWDESEASRDSWQAFQEQADRVSRETGETPVADSGDVEGAFAHPDHRVADAFYQYGFVSHLCLEPQNCTADYRHGTGGQADSLELWIPSQIPGRARQYAQSLFGLNPEDVTIHQLRMGGGFGRRTSYEYANEAIAMSRQVGAPVKNLWTRTDDIQHDYFRAAGAQRLRAALDAEGRLVAWQNHFVGVSNRGKVVPGSVLQPSEFPMLNLNHARASQTALEIATPCSYWRAPGANVNGFVVQSFLHELSVLAGRDHLEFLLEIMGEPRYLGAPNQWSLHTGRASAVIRLAAERGGWGGTVPDGEGLGLAFHFSHAAYVAELAHVGVDEAGKVKVHKVTAAVDVGPVINLSGAEGQVEGAIIDGISAMMGQKITMEGGRIAQTNLHEYPVLRMPHAPVVEAHFIQSDTAPSGLGEPALPPVAPAICNAIFTVTGKRVRTLPIADAGFAFA
ncbi:xanthine dehydrogenase family protein molybdopterin-binding subunit [Parahaliea maris]|uniref:Xanthine dehydrogenase family protein molybdopterin-binding subunit n=1 Tax=Parahaliea maris TaxID=2716870 RepID=A0A5C8ZWU3_9GAMM|nr:molybdopterin cofactor-binding domain-containing protein [Parahaliea maris]TXS92040.1 xanthine dehydrogenase family protein molybdopterin-binding subunit [Parahaliea maris]